MVVRGIEDVLLCCRHKQHYVEVNQRFIEVDISFSGAWDRRTPLTYHSSPAPLLHSSWGAGRFPGPCNPPLWEVARVGRTILSNDQRTMHWWRDRSNAQVRRLRTGVQRMGRSGGGKAKHEDRHTLHAALLWRYSYHYYHC